MAKEKEEKRQILANFFQNITIENPNNYDKLLQLLGCWKSYLRVFVVRHSIQLSYERVLLMFQPVFSFIKPFNFFRRRTAKGQN